MIDDTRDTIRGFEVSAPSINGSVTVCTMCVKAYLNIADIWLHPIRSINLLECKHVEHGRVYKATHKDKK